MRARGGHHNDLFLFLFLFLSGLSLSSSPNGPKVYRVTVRQFGSGCLTFEFTCRPGMTPQACWTAESLDLVCAG